VVILGGDLLDLSSAHADWLEKGFAETPGRWI
jgi:hypothetical protein